MRVLITGIGGFVGGVFAHAFLNAGWRVTGVCRNRRPTRLAARPNLDIAVTDLRDCKALPERYDCLVHCAADVPATCPDPDEMFRSNVEGTRRLFAQATDAGARHVVYMSSMAVYGKISVPVVREDTPPEAPDVYGRSKEEGERLLAEWVGQTGGAGASIRLPGVVGAGGRNNFLCDTLQRIMGDQPVSARNPDAMFNNVVHVVDLAAFVVSLADRMPRGHTVLTVAARDPLPIREALQRLYRGVGRREQIVWKSGGGSPFIIAFDRACALGYRPATVADCIDRFVSDSLTEAARG